MAVLRLRYVRNVAFAKHLQKSTVQNLWKRKLITHHQPWKEFYNAAQCGGRNEREIDRGVGGTVPAEAMDTVRVNDELFIFTDHNPSFVTTLISAPTSLLFI